MLESVGDIERFVVYFGDEISFEMATFTWERNKSVCFLNRYSTQTGLEM